MNCARLVLLLCLLPQEDARIGDWIRALEEDSAAARDKAFASLIQAGEAAEPALKRAAETGSIEARTRATEALKAISWKRHYDPAPKLITLRRDGTPLKSVLDDLAKLTATPIKVEGIDEALTVVPITVSVENVPLFKALEAVCRTHGKIDYAPNCGWGQEPMVYIEEESFADCPRVVDGTIELKLQGVTAAATVNTDGTRSEHTTFAFAWAWEKGTRPLGGRVDIDEIVDDAGVSHQSRLEHADEQLSVGHLQTTFDRTMPCIPADGVNRFKVIKGALVVVLPLSVQEFLFDKPATMLGQTQSSRWGNVTLADFEAGSSVYHVKVETRPEELLHRTRVVLLDADGKEFLGSSHSVGEMGDYGFWEMEYPQEDGRTAAAVRCRAEVGRRERRIPFEFRDVRFRGP